MAANAPIPTKAYPALTKKIPAVQNPTAIVNKNGDAFSKAAYAALTKVVISQSTPLAKNSCPDCKGKGQITLFTSVEPCAKCGGKGTV